MTNPRVRILSGDLPISDFGMDAQFITLSPYLAMMAHRQLTALKSGSFGGVRS
jgi:hypothetical protein